MLKNFMKLAGAFLMFCYVAAYFVLFRQSAVIGRYAWLAWLGPLGLVCAVYLATRALTFQLKFTRFARRLLEGNYDSGIQTHRISRDEVRELADLTNRVADRLRLYDSLRADRVAVNARACEVMHDRAKAPVIIADIDAGNLRFNPAARDLFGVEQETMSIESIVKRPENEEFARLFENAVEEEKVPHTAHLSVTLPVRNVTREVSVDIVPIKDREEEVKFVLLFLS